MPRGRSRRRWRLRYLGPRAWNTLNTVRSRATTLLNLGARYVLNRHLTLQLDVFNIAGSKESIQELGVCGAIEVDLLGLK